MMAECHSNTRARGAWPETRSGAGAICHRHPLGNADLGRCLDGKGFIDESCAWDVARNLGPGEVVMLVNPPGGARPVDIFDLTPPGGFTEHIDGMPAVLNTEGPPGWTGKDQGRTWRIGNPLDLRGWYTFSAAMRGPDIAELQADVDAVARSLRYRERAPTLTTDPTAIAATLRRALDRLDRDGRVSYHTRFYACFPRTSGASSTATITDGIGGPLAGPLEVTCSVAIEPTNMGFWQLTLSVSWRSGPGYKAGVFEENVYVDVDGREWLAKITKSAEFPATRAVATPRPASTPIILAPGLSSRSCRRQPTCTCPPISRTTSLRFRQGSGW